MVKRLAPLALLAFLTGCPDDLGENLGGQSVGLLAPAHLTATAESPLKVTVTWEDQSTTETAFRLEYSNDPFTSPTVPQFTILPAGTTGTTLSSAPSTTWYFRVFAVTETTESEPSNETNVVTPQYPGPNTLVVRNLGYVTLTYDDVTGEDGYFIEYSEDLVSWTRYNLAIPPDITSVAVTTGLVSGKPYFFRVFAVFGPWTGYSSPIVEHTAI